MVQDDEVGVEGGLGWKNLIGLMFDRCVIEGYCNFLIFLSSVWLFWSLGYDDMLRSLCSCLMNMNRDLME